MIARCIAQSAAGVLGESGEDQYVAAMRRQGRQDAGELEIRAVGSRRPLIHDDAVRNIDEREAERRAGRNGGSKRGNHRVEQGERHGGTEATEDGAAAEAFIHENHYSCESSIMIASTSCAKVSLPVAAGREALRPSA